MDRDDGGRAYYIFFNLILNVTPILTKNTAKKLNFTAPRSYGASLLDLMRFWRMCGSQFNLRSMYEIFLNRYPVFIFSDFFC